MEEEKPHIEKTRKTSTFLVILFILAVLTIIGLAGSGISYSNIVSLLWTSVIGGFLIWLAYYAKKRAVKKDLSGIKLGTFTIYTFIIVLIIQIIGSIALMSFAQKLQNFATTQTPTFFSNNLNGLINNSTDHLSKVLSYGDTTKKLTDEFSAVGVIKECVPEKNDISIVSFGPYMNFNSVAIGLNGMYSIRCYGDKKPFDFQAILEYKKGTWHVDDYQYNIDIDKDFNFQNTKNTPSQTN